jgi:hypothetical protein
LWRHILFFVLAFLDLVLFGGARLVLLVKVVLVDWFAQILVLHFGVLFDCA